MDPKRLDHKLDCKACGTIQMDIPDNATEHISIHCTSCGGYLGEWENFRTIFTSRPATLRPST